MPNPRRRERLGALIEQILSDLIRQMKDPRVAGLVSITRVQVAPDASLARIFISVMGSEEQRRDTMRGLEHAAGFLRSKLGEELTIRHVPELHFTLDRSIEQGDRVLALINQLEAQPAAATAIPDELAGDDAPGDEDDEPEDAGTPAATARAARPRIARPGGIRRPGPGGLGRPRGGARGR